MHENLNTYVLLLRNESIDFGAYSPEEVQRIVDDFDTWNAKMIGDGRLLASASLQGGGGKTLRGNVISDGPYSEAREAVAGLLLIQAASEEEAVEIASGCPFLARGGSVELRLTPKFDFEDAALARVNADMQRRAAQVGEEA